MTQKIKKIFLLTLAVSFLITSFLVVCYSLGWRFDWKAKKITQPGIFYFKVLPKNAQIYLNGKLKKKTDIFFDSALIDNLLPRKYNVEIKKQSFYSWQKTLEIKKRQVTEAKSIVLVPKNQNFNEISKNIKNVFFSPNNKKAIWEELAIANFKKSNQSAKKKWSLKLFDLNKNLKSQLIGEKDILSVTAGYGKDSPTKNKNIKLISLKFSPDSKTALLKIGLDTPLTNRKTKLKNEKSIHYFLLKINKIPAKLIPLNFLKGNIKEIYFNPQDSQKLFLLTSQTTQNNKQNKRIEEVELNKRKVYPTPLKNIIAFSVSNNNIYYLNKSGFIYKTDFSFQDKEKLNMVPFPLKETKYKIVISKLFIILKADKSLYLLQGKKSFQKISDSVKDFRFSLDSKKIVYFNDHEIWILFLEKKYDQPAKEKGEQLFLTRFSEKIGKLFWWTNNYLIFNAGNKIKIAETDDRDKINIVELANFENPQIFWNQKNGKLYVLSKESLFNSQKLTP